jgi:sigma-B regulation protein RsbU (phosphoserine phosphatase)
MDNAFDLYNTTDADWQQRLAYIVETMKETSRMTRPQEMVRNYATRMRSAMPSDWFLSISRRGVEPPQYVIARSEPGDPSQAEDGPNPWTQRDQLPVMQGGLLGELVYSNEPAILDEFTADPDDPAYEILKGHDSLAAIPVYDGGESMNMIMLLFKGERRLDRRRLPQVVWTTNLFGRATHNLVLSDELKRAYELVDREMKVIADIQRALLPAELPSISTMDVARLLQPRNPRRRGLLRLLRTRR